MNEIANESRQIVENSCDQVWAGVKLSEAFENIFYVNNARASEKY